MTDAPAVIAAEPAPPAEALHRPFRHPAPRYATYPAAEHFNARFGASDLRTALSVRRVASQTVCLPLAVHVHIPFRGTRHHERVAPYLDALEREVTLVVEQIGACRSVARLHFGGESPSFLDDAELSRLVALLRRNFFLLADAEVAIEVDPRAVDGRRLAHLKELGFNHLILAVGHADHAPLHDVAAVMAAARRLGFASIDVDVSCAMRESSVESFQRVLAGVAALRPDRIGLQARDRRQGHPGSTDSAGLEADRAALRADALSCVGAAGYDVVGVDRFALAGDALARARRDAGLHMTLQGYRAQPDHDVLGFGVSAIGVVGDCLYQNARTLAAYYGALESDRLPAAHGHVLDADDRVRRDIMLASMCASRIDFADILARHGVDVRSAFAGEITRLAPLAARGLVELHGDRIDVTPRGMIAADEIAAVFDRYLHQGLGPARPARRAR